MTDREGIIRLATEYMGWKAKRDGGDYFYGAFEYADSEGRRCTRFGWNPFEFPADARELESAIPEAKRRKYVDALLAGMDDPSLFNLAHATPRQRSQAALAVLDTEER